MAKGQRDLRCETNMQAVGAAMTNVPGIWTPEQITEWKKVVSDVKSTGAVFVAQRRSTSFPVTNQKAEKKCSTEEGHAVTLHSSAPVALRLPGSRTSWEAEQEMYRMR